MYLEKRQSPETQPEIDLGVAQEGLEHVYRMDADVTFAGARGRALVASQGLAVVRHVSEDQRASLDQDIAELRAPLASEID